MKHKRINANQVEKNIARILTGNTEKIRQLEKIEDISCHLTSDDGIDITCELYDNNIVRYLIKGTRCGMTITANALTNEIMRKPNGIKPYRTEHITSNVCYILARIEQMEL